jgi:iron(III) transport system permease protein
MARLFPADFEHAGRRSQLRGVEAEVTAPRRASNLVPHLCAAVIAAFFVAFLAFPLAHVLRGAFTVDGEISLDGFRLALGNAVFVQSLSNSLWVATAVTLLSSAIALPLAWLFHAFRFGGKGIYQTLLLAALVLPPIIGAVGFRQIFARFGSLNLVLLECGLIREPIDFLGSDPLIGVIIVGALHLYPILFLNLQATLANVDPTLFEAAAASGASRATRFFRIGLPLVLPGFFAGAVIVFIFAVTDLGAPLVFDARMLVPMQIFERAAEGSRDPVGYSLVVTVVVLTAGLFALGRRIVGGVAPSSAAKGATTQRLHELSPPARILVQCALVLLVIVTLLPHLSVLLLSFSRGWFFTVLPESWTLSHYSRIATDEIAFLGIKNSLTYALLSTLVDLVLGAAIAWLVVRRGGPIAAILDVAAMLPLALPGIVLAFGYVYAFSGTALDSMANPQLLLVAGYAMRRLPYVVRSADAGFRQMPVALEEAARGLGASGAQTWRRVTIPLLAGHLLAGGILAFSFALLEVSESLILAPTKDSYPIAKAIYILAGDLANGAQVASAMGIVGSAILLYSLFVAGKLLGKNMGELFRT